VSDFAIGSVVFEKYEIIEYIASGGNGRVYKAKDVLRNVHVALKVLLQANSDDKQVMRFQTEARTTSRLNHPNIATIFDFGVLSSTPYLVMEFVDGETLESILEKQVSLPLPRFCEIFLQISDALNHAHENGVVHRDLKPANVIIREDDGGKVIAKILDFGIAKVIDQNDPNLTPTGNIIGSPFYMSPEQARGEVITAKADLYSLGSMMFRSLTGEVPLSSESAIETIMLVAKTPAPLLEKSSDGKNLPQQLCQLVNQLLAKEPLQRPSLTTSVSPVLEQLRSELIVTGEAKPEKNQDINNSTVRYFSGGSALQGTAGATTSKKRSNVTLLFAAVVTLAFLTIIMFISFKSLSPAGQEAVVVKPPQEMSTLDAFAKLPGDEEIEFGKIEKHSVKSHKARLTAEGDIQLTDKALRGVSNPEIFRELQATRTPLKTLEHIGRFENLTELLIGHTDVDDNALKHLTSLTKLRMLNVEGDNITDEGLREIASVHSLQVLNLSATQVTPDGLRLLSKNPLLKHLALERLNLSRTDVDRFAASIAPHCRVDLPGNSLTNWELQKLSKDYPDLSFNGAPSAISQKRLQIEKLIISPPKTTKGLLQAKSITHDVISQVQQTYGKDTPRVSSYLIALGTFERQSGKPDSSKTARKLYEKAIAMSIENGDEINELSALDRLIELSMVTSGYAKSKNMALRSIELGNRVEAYTNHNENFSRYLQLGTSAHAEKQIKTGIGYFEKAKQIGVKRKDHVAIALAEFGIAQGEYRSNNHSAAIASFKKVIQTFEDFPSTSPAHRRAYTMSQGYLGNVFYLSKKIFQSIGIQPALLRFIKIRQPHRRTTCSAQPTTPHLWCCQKIPIGNRPSD